MNKSGLQVLIVNGKPGSGKTTFENFCQEKLGEPFCQMRSTVDKVKELAREGGWNGGKELRDREFLSDLKDLFTDYNDMPLNDICNFLKGWESELEMYGVQNLHHVLFVDDREPEHIERLKKKLESMGIQVFTLLIRRAGDEYMEVSNHADANVLGYDYDFTVFNHGDLKRLKDIAEQFVDLLYERRK